MYQSSGGDFVALDCEAADLSRSISGSMHAQPFVASSELRHVVYSLPGSHPNTCPWGDMDI